MHNVVSSGCRRMCLMGSLLWMAKTSASSLVVQQKMQMIAVLDMIAFHAAAKVDCGDFNVAPAGCFSGCRALACRLSVVLESV